MIEFLLGAQGHAVPAKTTSVVFAGMVVLAAYDVWRTRVEDWATAALLMLAAGGLVLEGVSSGQWVTGVLSAGVAFAVYLALGMRGAMGGGDVKLSVVPALVLGASNPFLGVWWVSMSFLIHQGLITLTRVTLRSTPGGARSAPLALPHVPAMSAAMAAAILLFPM